MAENMALGAAFSSYTFANATNADIQDSSDDAVGIDGLLVGSDYGVELFGGSDTWDIIELCGLVGIQSPEQRPLVDSMLKYEAHERLLNSKGGPMKND
jgi:hypothetical protein